VSAKNLLKIQYQVALEDAATRLEETAKVYANMGTTDLKFEEIIDGVTGSQIEEAVKAGLKSTPSIVLQGANVKSLPTFDKLASSFQ
jgi:protein-disulfide isomerase